LLSSSSSAPSTSNLRSVGSFRRLCSSHNITTLMHLAVPTRASKISFRSVHNSLAFALYDQTDDHSDSRFSASLSARLGQTSSFAVAVQGTTSSIPRLQYRLYDYAGFQTLTFQLRLICRALDAPLVGMIWHIPPSVQTLHLLAPPCGTPRRRCILSHAMRA